MKDRSKLTRKQITDRTGKRTTVWVKQGEDSKASSHMDRIKDRQPKGGDVTGMKNALLKQYGDRFTDGQKKVLQSPTSKMYSKDGAMTVYEGDKMQFSFTPPKEKESVHWSDEQAAAFRKKTKEYLSGMDKYGFKKEGEKNEGEEKKSKHPKSYYTQDGVGSSKYTVSFHDGEKTHKDGSPFYDIRIFKNKVKRDAFVKELKGTGYNEK